jgi:glyoxylase-like metal-dependent hydrolase (beta-lactamase superfamily II)
MMRASLFIEPFVDEGLGNSAYLVGSHETQQAALIDPLRDVDRYLAAAERLSVKITHVLDTHLHADFIPARANSPRGWGVDRRAPR